MTPTRDEWIPFGTVTRAHGVRGELRLVPHNAGDFLPEAVSSVALGEARRVMQLAGIRRVHGALLIRIEGIHDRDAAQALAGQPVWLHRDNLPELAEGEFYLFEILGASVCDEAGAILGRVARVDTSSAQDLLVIEAEPPGERLLPLVPETVVAFRRDEVTLVVKVPAGLWEGEEGGRDS